MVDFECIKNIDVELYGVPLDNEIVFSQKNEIFKDKSLPFSFEYNGSWLIKHFCSNGKECSFGLDYNPKKNKFPQKSFKLTSYLCSKYFDYNTLCAINNVFNTTELIQYENNYYVVKQGKFNPDFSISSSIKLAYYKCTNKYLCLLDNNPPYAPDKENPQGFLGKVIVSEIIRIKSISTSLEEILCLF